MCAQKRWGLGSAVLFCCIALLVACGTEPEADAPADLQITVEPAPGGLDGELLRVQLTDNAGTPITDATVAVEGNMNHAGMAPVMADAVTDEADGTADGIYQVPFQFTMLGDWIISVTVERADGSTITRDIDATVGEEEVVVEDTASVDTSTDASTDASTMEGMEGADTMGMATEAENAEQMGQLMVDQLFARPAPVAGGNGAVYLRLQNATDTDDQLVGVTTDVAEVAELHETINDNNVMRMEPRPDGFRIPAGGELVLEPGGKHIMLVNLTEPLLDGDLITLTLTFAHAPPMPLEVVVGVEDGPVMMDHEQMGSEGQTEEGN